MAFAATEIIGSFTEEETTVDAWIDSGQRFAVLIPRDDSITKSLDGRHEKTSAFNFKIGDTPNGSIVDTVDNGPNLKAAKKNGDARVRLKLSSFPKSDPLKESYERGELGLSEPENRAHWFDAQRFRRAHADARGEPDTGRDDWRQLMRNFLEGFFEDSLTGFEADEGLVLSHDMEFDDSTTSSGGEAIVEPHVGTLYAQQVVNLMTDVLGQDYEVLLAAVERRWTNQKLGETEGYTDRASASACGKGMLRSALRNLSRFYAGLDRLEMRGDRPRDVWPLVGTLNWPPVKYAPGYYREREAHFMNRTSGPVRKWRDDLIIAA
jgi:hypothetical protein